MTEEMMIMRLASEIDSFINAGSEDHENPMTICEIVNNLIECDFTVICEALAEVANNMVCEETILRLDNISQHIQKYQQYARY